jgi:hypothetical protein
MRRIVLCISVVVLVALSCTSYNSTYVVDGDVSIAYLRTLADERSQRLKRDIWIEGDVVLNDKLDEAYKSIVLYDATAGVEVKVDAEDVDVVLPLFSHLRLRCEGLHIGREGERVVLGAKPTAEYVVDRLSASEFANRITIIEGQDNTHGAMTIAAGDVQLALVSSYVRIESLSIITQESGLMWCDEDAVDRPYEYSLRHFTNGSDTVTVATLNKCHYATEPIPDDVVTLMGVVDSYEGSPVLRISNCSVHK